MDIRIVTANVDFALRPKTVQEDLEYIVEHADIITFQEAKRVDVDRLLKDPDWAVHQPDATDALKGSGVAWRTSVAKRKGVGRRIGTKPLGRAMLARYIVWVRLEIDGQDIVVASLHMPPKRFWNVLYRRMLGSVERFILSRKTPIIIGGDWNKLVLRATDLRELAGQRQGKFFGHGIDGFLVIAKGKLWVTETKKLRDTNSDHDPVQIKVRVRT